MDFVLLLFLRNFLQIIGRFRVAYGTANVHLYHVTVSLTFLYFYKKNKYFYVFFIHKNCFRLLLSAHVLFLRSFQLESAVGRLPKCHSKSLYYLQKIFFGAGHYGNISILVYLHFYCRSLVTCQQVHPYRQGHKKHQYD